MLDRPGIRLAPIAVIVGVCVAILGAAFAGSGASTVGGRLGGDFPAFYAAGRIVIEGSGDVLYDPATQAEFQEALYPQSDGYLFFAYPPFTAVAYAALAILPYRLAFAIHGLLAVAALWGAVRLARPLLPSLLRSRRHELAAVAVMLAMYPILRSVLGGQNTAFTILLLAAVWRFGVDHHPAFSGLSLAALLYKPQYGVLALMLVAAARRWKILAWWLAGAAVAYLAGVAVAGWGWPASWLDQSGVFNDENLVVNGDLMVSSIGWFRSLFGVVQTWPGVVGFGLAAVVGLATAVAWWRRGIEAEALALASTAIVIGAPSALYYDAGIAAGAIAVGAERSWPGRARVVAGVVVVSWSQLAASTLGWSPLFPVLVGVFIWSAAAVYRTRSADTLV